MKLNQLLETEERLGEIEITGVSNNTQNLRPGDLFLATTGAGVDRHEFIAQAFEKGAPAAVVQLEWRPDFERDDFSKGAALVRVPNVDAIAPGVFAEFEGNPQRDLELLAVTGTDGKTSVSTIVQTLLGENICGVIGTNGINFGEDSAVDAQKVREESFNTTPGYESLYRYLAQFKAAGAKTVAMEASSEAEHFGRLQGLQFAATALTNITSEHLNTHGTLENYIAAKVAILKNRTVTGGAVILNANCEHFSEVFSALAADNEFDIFTYGSSADCDLQIVDLEIQMTGTRIHFRFEGRDFEVNSPLLGDFNAENLACALLVLLARGYAWEDLEPRIAQINIAGRLDMIDLGQDFSVMVDYAHTPNGISRLLEFVKRIPGVRRRITVIGQAGERDATKRSTVGKIVASNSDLTFFTEEDPKNEPVAQTIAMITEQLSPQTHNWQEIHRRGEAIEAAIMAAQSGDLVMVLGKGAETFQKIGSKKVDYCDVEEVKRALLKRLG